MFIPQTRTCGCGESFLQENEDIICCTRCHAIAPQCPNPYHKPMVIRRCKNAKCRSGPEYFGYFETPRLNGTRCAKCQRDDHYKKLGKPLQTSNQAIQKLVDAKTKPETNSSCRECGSHMTCKGDNPADHWSNTCGQACKKTFFTKFYNELYKAWILSLTRAEQISLANRKIVLQQNRLVYEGFESMDLIPIREEAYTDDYISMLASYEKKIDATECSESKKKAEYRLASIVKEIAVKFNAVPFDAHNHLVQVMNFQHNTPFGLKYQYLVKLSEGGVNRVSNMEYMLPPKAMVQYNEYAGSKLTPDRFRLIREYSIDAIEQGISIQQYMQDNGISSWKDWLVSKGVGGVENA